MLDIGERTDDCLEGGARGRCRLVTYTCNARASGMSRARCAHTTPQGLLPPTQAARVGARLAVRGCCAQSHSRGMLPFLPFAVRCMLPLHPRRCGRTAVTAHALCMRACWPFASATLQACCSERGGSRHCPHVRLSAAGTARMGGCHHTWRTGAGAGSSYLGGSRSR